MWARTLCPLLSSTRNIAFGRASTTVPSISITPSFFGMSSLLVVVRLVYRRPGNLPDPRRTAGAGGPLAAVAQTSSRAHTSRWNAGREVVRAAARHRETDPSGADTQV